MSTTVSTTEILVDPSGERLADVLARQRAAHRRDGIPDLETRLSRIDRLALAILEHVDEIVEALDADFGNRPALASLRSDIIGGVSEAEYLRAHLEEWMRPSASQAGPEMGIPVTLEPRPVGVVGVIGPWNFPVGLVIQPALEALAAGNRVMIKFSDIPERTGAVVARAVASRLDPDEVTVVLGGRETAVAFSELPFDHLFFTGSPAVGRVVAAAAGRNLVPVTLELGGKNPVLVSAEADIAEAAARVAAARMNNGGQLCLCPDDVYVPRAQADTFVEAYSAAIRAALPEYATNPDAITIINDANFARVTRLLDDARARGARVDAVPTGAGDDTLPDATTRRIAPTIVRDATDDMLISREEIFGPVIVVRPYDDVAEVIARIADGPHPLVAYYYGPEGTEFRRYVDETASGGVTRNDLALHLMVPDVPFGGIGTSGTGAYHGKAGFDTFSQVRPVASPLLPFSIAQTVGAPFPEPAREEQRAQIEALRATVASRVAR
ncbi:aldehyde dehydrogenase family protein [Microbacterium sp. SLBN-111]|uniref:aldehyde dehydrogenase family protein n=1 Tax=Microbacterium sp. SLBN-111 TaxID=3377733 RepID=UPI003C75CA94